MPDYVIYAWALLHCTLAQWKQIALTMPPHRFADSAKYRADCTGNVRLRHCLPPLERRLKDAL